MHRRVLMTFGVAVVGVIIAAITVNARSTCGRRVCGDAIATCRAVSACPELHGNDRARCKTACIDEILAACDMVGSCSPSGTLD